MSITSLRPLMRLDAVPVPNALRFRGIEPNTAELFAITLLRLGRISAHDLMQALALQARHSGHLIDHLLGLGVDEAAVYADLAQHWAVGLADFDKRPLDPDLLMQVDPVKCLTQSWLPWRKLGQTTVIACAHPEDFAALRADFEHIFGPCILAIAPRRQIEAALISAAGSALARRAETRVAPQDSCRDYTSAPLLSAVMSALMMAAALMLLAPGALILGAFAAMMVVFFSQVALKFLAVWPRKPVILAPAAPRPAIHLVPDPNPAISIIVALYKESRIVARLIRRLDMLDYPRDKLDVIFVIEDNDTATQSALAGLQLPPWLRVLAVPTGTIRTKPRALNYALDHCRGDIIGVYDAEDAPPQDQLHIVANTFAKADDRLACLQGRLDYFNPHTNWLARCFTIEYAAWWRLFLPGIERMGLALPLGGTTLFFRKQALLDLGGWDAHNVTEDADLGLRIARRGYVTALIPSVTMEEANCRVLPWIKQRSRWIKGYMITWATHMRDPAKLLRDLGARRFIGFQVMFAGTILQALMAPLMWALWLIPFGLKIPALDAIPPAALMTLAATGLVSEALVMGCNYAGLLKTGHKINPLWLPSMILYNMLASFAAYKALWEMLRKPFYWDKTSHGFFDG